MQDSYLKAVNLNATNSFAQLKLDTAVSQIKNSTNDKSSEIKNASQEFEAVFISQMLNLMFKSVPVNEVFGGGYAEETFREFLVDEYGTIIAKQGGIGVADSLQKSLLKMQLSGNQNARDIS
jgi:Rod binding domain-containing protein